MSSVTNPIEFVGKQPACERNFIGNNSDTRKSIGKITAGIFNTETLEIEWHYSLPDEARNHFFVGQPQANEKYFGVKDNKDVLYVFER